MTSPTTPTPETAPEEEGYLFRDPPVGPAGPPEGQHHLLLDHLAEMLDPFTRRRLEQAGRLAGARCLEVGAGAGTIAEWLAGRVGPDGEVIATDLDPSRIPTHPRITPLTHDIAADPIPPGGYDLIHARLVLAHLPERRQVLTRLVAALNPGGALVIDEFDASWNRCILSAPTPHTHRLFHAYHHVLLAALVAAGADPTWGRQCHQAMHHAGLIDVDTELWSRSWHGGEAGCLLPYTAAGQLHDRLVTTGIHPDDLAAFRTLLLDPRLVIHGNTAISTTGRKPPPRSD